MAASPMTLAGSPGTLRHDWVKHGSPAYWACVSLRDEVLRKPIGLRFSDQELESEDHDLHLAVWHELVVVGCLVLSPLTDEAIKMRQVAVHPEWQGQGLGKQMVAESERISRSKHYKRILLHAREGAVPFYLKLGYTVIDAPFREVGIPHRRMVKVL